MDVFGCAWASPVPAESARAMAATAITATRIPAMDLAISLLPLGTHWDGVDAVDFMLLLRPCSRSRPQGVPHRLLFGAPACHPISRSATHAAMLTIWSSTKAMGSSSSSSRNRVHPSFSSRSLILTPRARRSMLRRDCPRGLPGVDSAV